MNNKAKVLLIVEGEKLERQFFDQLKKAYDLDFEIVCVKNNIYSLFKKMKSLDFQADIRQILIEMTKDDTLVEHLQNKFAYTYLIFDLDAHHKEEYEKNEPLHKIIAANFERLYEMTEYFTDETDPTIGKLYINYPMMESFKDCNSFDDDNYLTSRVSIEDLGKYKALVGSMKMANKRLDSYDAEDFNRLSKLNVKKLHSISEKHFISLSYADYQELSNQSAISTLENKIFKNDNAIFVLNTSSFFALDYFGNKNGFFDNIMKETE